MRVIYTTETEWPWKEQNDVSLQHAHIPNMGVLLSHPTQFIHTCLDPTKENSNPSLVAVWRERKIERKWLVTLSGLKREGDQGGLLQAFLLFLFQNHIPLKEASVEHRISNWPCICLWRARWVLDIRGIRFQFQFQVLLCWERT